MSIQLIIIGFFIILFLLRKYYGEPPCIGRKVISTVTPLYADSPLVKIQEDAVSFIHHRESDGFHLYFHTDSNTIEKFSEKNCFPSTEVDELTHYKYQ